MRNQASKFFLRHYSSILLQLLPCCILLTDIVFNNKKLLPVAALRRLYSKILCEAALKYFNILRYFESKTEIHLVYINCNVYKLYSK